MISVSTLYNSVELCSSWCPLFQVIIGVENNRRGEYKRHDLSSLTNGASLKPSLAVGNNRIYVLTEEKVITVPVQQCHSASNCLKCKELNDPQCGWCSLSSRLASTQFMLFSKSVAQFSVCECRLGYDWSYVTRYSCTTLADCPRSDSQGNWLQDSCFDPELDIEDEESFI